MVSGQYVGYGGAGTFTHSGGTNTVTGGNALYLGANGGSGKYQLSNTGILSVSGPLLVGETGNGTFTQSGGTATASSLYVGTGATSGLYELQGGSLTVSNVEFIGVSGAATFTHTGGTHQLTGPNSLFIGYAYQGAGGTYNISGTGVLNTPASGRLVVGAYTNGAMNVTAGGTVNAGNEFVICENSPGNGTVSVTGAGARVTANGRTYVGAYGPGALTIGSGGVFNSNGGASIAHNGAGTATINAGGTWNASDVDFGSAGGIGTLNINAGGTMAVTGAMTVWNSLAPAPAGTRVNLSGGALSVASLYTDGEPARFNWTAGTLGVTGAAGLAIAPAGPLGANVNVGPAQTLNVANGLAIGSGGSLTVSGAMSAGSLSVATGGTLDFAHAGAFTWPGVITGGGTINKTGAGVLTLPVDWTHTGVTNLNAGTIKLTGPGGLGNQTVLNIASGATYDQSGGGDIIEMVQGTGSIINVGTLFLGASGTSGTFSGSITGGPSSRIVRLAGGQSTFNGSTNVAKVEVNAGGITQAGGSMSTGSISVVGAFGGNFQWTGGSLTANTATLTNAALMKIAAGGNKTLRLDTLSASDGSKLDLSDNKLVLKSMPLGTAGGGGSYTGVSGLVQSGQHEGAWDGGGIMTSMPDAQSGLTALGLATAEQAGYAGGTFGGVSVSGDDVLVMYTYAGDANLDGFVSGDDYSAIDFNILVPGTDGWYNGDFNYDGAITGDDYSAIDFNILAQGAPFSTASAATLSGVATVPEPCAAGSVAVSAAASLLGRRRRKLRPLAT